MSRVQERATFDEHTRVALLESDADDADVAFEKLDKRIAKLMAISVSTFISMCTAIVLLVVDIAVRSR
jgi:hypothetical protein